MSSESLDQASSDLSRLKHFSLLAKLSDPQLVVLSSRADYRRYSKGAKILDLGSQDSYDYFLLEGEVALTAEDGRTALIAAASQAARQPIAHLQPRRYEVKAKSPCVMLVVDQPTLTRMLKDAPLDYQIGEGVSQVDRTEHPAYSLITSFYQDLNAHRLTLPSLPDMAMRIRHVTEQPNFHLNDISKVIVRDPVLTAKLIRSANSPLYRGFKEIECCEDAVVRLGLDTTRQLITIFTLREIFRSKNVMLQKRMTKLWRHSSDVGAISFVLARMTPGIKPEQALLAGILHDIGVVPVIMYAEEHPALRTHEDMLETLIMELRQEIGCALLESWEFPDAFVAAARHAEDYMYDSGQETPTYADLVIVAQIHSYIGKPEHGSIPPLDQVPAFHKLALGELSPQRSLQVLQMAEEEINSVRRLLTD
ncbi:HDOD domain-containing protein [Hahella aquimaris]|uniref:HDOD domain-containing protein n=1 Tax=Hahella sp. HNIBRBA332 TaxID=3015983 RepID=UPI00273C5B2A|nr:HDOD domain-containing protein [Hahella sp. HNIBRBA332]WLQ14131.1 HDOD domain-containing protein [Hahella sp. HNIBRBA332]